MFPTIITANRTSLLNNVHGAASTKNNNRLRYRFSTKGLATSPQDYVWEKSLFTKTADTLPGLPHSNIMDEVSYPRFVTVNGDMLLTYRIGQFVLPSPNPCPAPLNILSR